MKRNCKIFLASATEEETMQPSGVIYSPAQLAERTKYRRAVEAVIWGMPLVNTDAMRQAYFRDIGAKYNDICYFSKPPDWRFQVTTPNASTNYVYFNFNLKDGPVVLDVPPIDLYFGPKAPPGQESNWIATAPNRGWFVGFRLYGPDKPLFDRTWKLPDMEPVR